MGTVIDFNTHRRRRLRSQTRPQRAQPRPQPSAPNMVCCSHCGEPHPIVRFQGGEQRCVTAFFDGTHWFCRNRGCRRAWLAESRDG